MILSSRFSVLVAYSRLKRLMRAVLAPCLRQRLHLAIGWRALLAAEIALDRLHLGQVEREHAGLADPQKLGLIGVEQRHTSNLRGCLGRLAQQVGIKCPPSLGGRLARARR